jgi:capping protein alpha
MAEQEASAESKLNIATYFIMNSPVGEVHDVVADVQKLVNDPGVLNDGQVQKILKDYNVDQLTTAPDPANEQNMLMVCAAGMVDETSFLDPNTGRVLKFDHKKQRFTEVTERKQVLDGEIAKFRASIAKSVEAYVNDNYKSGKCVTSTFGADSGKVTICVSAKNTNLGNYWTGGWRGLYSLHVERQGQVELKGSIKINVHYFEDGNVQLHSTLEKSANVNVSSDDATGKEVAKAIEKIESDFQLQLEDMYLNMHRTTFKAMRRFYPVTREKMNWTTSVHSLASEVTKS